MQILKRRARVGEPKTITDHPSWEMGENRLLSREMWKEQRNASCDGKMIALVWHKLSREMDFFFVRKVAGT